jgi:hypothetical protein
VELIEGTETRVLVVEALGLTVHELFLLNRRTISLQTGTMLLLQMVVLTHQLDVIESLHSNGMIHGALSPDCFSFGLDQTSEILYLRNLRHVTMYKNMFSGRHVAYEEDRLVLLFNCYSSINTLTGIRKASFDPEQSRRDDLESIGNILLHLLQPGLRPIKRIEKASKTLDELFELKIGMSTELLTGNLPLQFTTYMKYVRGMAFDEDPDYRYLKGIFKEYLKSCKEGGGTLAYEWFESKVVKVVFEVISRK